MIPDKKLAPLSAVCAAIVLFFIIVTLAATAAEMRFYRNAHTDYSDFSDGWYSESGEAVRLDKIRGSCRIHKVIPEMESHMTFSFNARNLNVDIYIDDECVYEYKRPDNAFLQRIYGKTAGSDFVEAKITKESAGKTLYIDAKCPYPNGRGSKIVNVYFGNSTSIVKHITATQLGPFCFGIMMLFMGTVCLILYFPLKRHNVVNKSMFYLGILSYIFGTMMITDSKMIHLVVGHETLYFTVSHMFMSIIPLPMLLFFENLYEDLNKKIVAALCALNLADCTAIFILNIMGIADYNENSFIVHMIFAICLFYIGAVTVQRMIRDKKKNIYHNIGVIVVAVSIVLDVAVSRINPSVESSSFMIIGVALFLCLECIQIMTILIDMNRKALRSQFISRLAYYDGLTDLLNRTSFQEDMEKLEKEAPADVLFAVFDVNDLKYVNDNFGHSCGDELIRGVAESIGKSFGDMGKCYRIGGDEFVLISVGENAENKFSEAKTAMDKLINETDSRTDYPVSVAAGYSVMNGRGVPLKDVLDEADERMYSIKRKMKAERAALSAT